MPRAGDKELPDIPLDEPGSQAGTLSTGSGPAGQGDGVLREAEADLRRQRHHVRGAHARACFTE